MSSHDTYSGSWERLCSGRPSSANRLMALGNFAGAERIWKGAEYRRCSRRGRWQPEIRRMSSFYQIFMEHWFIICFDAPSLIPVDLWVEEHLALELLKFLPYQSMMGLDSDQKIGLMDMQRPGAAGTKRRKKYCDLPASTLMKRELGCCNERTAARWSQNTSLCSASAMSEFCKTQEKNTYHFINVPYIVCYLCIDYAAFGR